MPSADSIISKILELDSQAEAIKTESIVAAAKVRDEYRQRIEREKEGFEQEKVKKIEQVRKSAEQKRETEVGLVRKEFAGQTAKIEQIPREKIDKTVNDTVARVKGIVQ